jgi:hypothetical protein
MSPMALRSQNGSASQQQAWLQTTVQDFFGNFNWEGLTPSEPIPTPSSADLFAGFAADFGADSGGIGIEVGHAPEGSTALTPPIPLNTSTLSVSLFFSTFPWEGQPVIGTPTNPAQSIERLSNLEAENTDDLTLDAFSDLF